MNLRKYLFTSSFIAAIAVIFVLLIAAGCAVILDKQNQLNNISRRQISQNNNSYSGNNSQIMVGNDRDEHGCIGSAGYSWCEPKQKCLRIWEETCYEDVKQEIQYLLAKKYNKSISDVNIGIIKMTDSYVSGSVKFIVEELPIPGEGGVFLAAKKDGIWTLVYDGNGSINCKEIKQQYNFPVEMLTGFCD